MELKNEFARIKLELDTKANGDRLKITDVKTGKSSFLDPLELAGLVWARHEDFEALLDPSRRTT